jgi:hypothetical protein
VFLNQSDPGYGGSLGALAAQTCAFPPISWADCPLHLFAPIAGKNHALPHRSAMLKSSGTVCAPQFRSMLRRIYTIDGMRFALAFPADGRGSSSSRALYSGRFPLSFLWPCHPVQKEGLPSCIDLPSQVAEIVKRRSWMGAKKKQRISLEAVSELVSSLR